MRQFSILLLAALMLVGTACSKQEAAQPTQPSTTPSGTTTPAPENTPAPGATTPSTTTPATPPANADAAKPTTPAPSTSKPDPAPVQAPKGAAEQPVATSDQYGTVDFGMTFEQVQKAMGGQMGKMISEGKDGDNVTQTYQYKTKEGGTLNITFRNGKVLNKSESSK